MKKHKEVVNFIDFREEHFLCASCSDDFTVIIYNYGSYRQEGILSNHQAEVKICKFLDGYDCLVSADLDGYLYFWAVTPHPKRNELICKVKDDNESEVGKVVNYPIRAIDFDSKRKILWTGDEMGFMQKWDLSLLLDKLEGASSPHKNTETKEEDPQDPTVFMTEAMSGAEPTVEDEEEEVKEDVTLIKRWKAHQDGINWVTFTEDPCCVSSCSFDRKVYIWNSGTCEKIGSLVLGKKKFWNINIDKSTRENAERGEAENMLDKANSIQYEKLFTKEKAEDLVF